MPLDVLLQARCIKYVMTDFNHENNAMSFALDLHCIRVLDCAKLSCILHVEWV